MGSRTGSKRALVLATLISSFLGCTEISLRAPDVDVRKGRLVFMPSMFRLRRIEGCDLVFDDSRSRAGRQRVDGWLRYYGAAAGARLASLDEVASVEPNVNDFYTVMDDLTGAMIADRGRQPLGDWKPGSALAGWATALRADYLGFVIVRGSLLLHTWQAFCGNQIRSPREWAALVVVEMQSGRIVRFRATLMDQDRASPLAEAVGRLMEALDMPGAPPN